MKTYEIKDKRNEAVTYQSKHNINRKTENNNVICKATPSLIAKVQDKFGADTTLDGEQVLRQLCSNAGIEVTNDDFEYRNPVDIQAEAVADATQSKDEAINTAITGMYKDGLKEEQIIEKFEKDGVSKEQLTPYFKSLQKEEEKPSLKSLFV